MADKPKTKALIGKKTPKQRKANYLVKNQLNKLAKEFVAEIQPEFYEKLAKKLDLSPKEAIEIAHMHDIPKQVNNMLVESLTDGAIAVKALETLTEHVAKGNLEAAKVVVALNKEILKSRPGPQVRDLHLHQHKDVNVFESLDKKAKELLDSRKE